MLRCSQPCACLPVHPQSLSGPSSSSSAAGGSKKQPKQAAGAVDIWTLLDILDAANLLLWTDLVRPGERNVVLLALAVAGVRA
jgi:hypothetical protein